MPLQPHIKCSSGDIAPIVLIPGDPARVKKIVEYWDDAREVANNREFLTYTGTYKGIPISATSTGIGSPSAAIAVEELSNIGAQAFIRIGTCGALKKDIGPGSLIIPFAALRAEGTTREYISEEFPSIADPFLFRTLEEGARTLGFPYTAGVVRTHDAFYEHTSNILRWAAPYQDTRMASWKYPLVGSEMECSAVFLVSMLRGLRAGAILAVNTIEPLDEIVKNPDAMFELIETSDTSNGIDRAIQTALLAVEKIAPTLS